MPSATGIITPANCLGVPCFAFRSESYHLSEMIPVTDWDSVIRYAMSGVCPWAASVVMSDDGTYIRTLHTMTPIYTNSHLDSEGRIKCAGTYCISLDNQRAWYLVISLAHVNFDGEIHPSNIPGHPDFVTSIVSFNGYYANPASQAQIEAYAKFETEE